MVQTRSRRKPATGAARERSRKKKIGIFLITAFMLAWWCLTKQAREGKGRFVLHG